MKTVFKKLHSRRGVTLVEMAAAVGVLALLGMMLHTGLFMAQRSYNKMMGESETQLLLSTLSDLLSNELRYARDVVTDHQGNLERYTSINYGRNTTLSFDKTGQLAANNRRMLSSGAYGNGEYAIKTLDITYNSSDQVFQVAVKVAGKYNISNETNFSVRCLNGTDDEGGSI